MKIKGTVICTPKLKLEQDYISTNITVGFKNGDVAHLLFYENVIDNFELGQEIEIDGCKLIKQNIYFVENELLQKYHFYKEEKQLKIEELEKKAKIYQSLADALKRNFKNNE